MATTNQPPSGRLYELWLASISPILVGGVLWSIFCVFLINAASDWSFLPTAALVAGPGLFALAVWMLLWNLAQTHPMTGAVLSALVGALAVAASVWRLPGGLGDLVTAWAATMTFVSLMVAVQVLRK